MVSNPTTAQWSPAAIDLDVMGLGRWQKELTVFLGEYPPPPPPPLPSQTPGALSPFPKTPAASGGSDKQV